MHTGNETIEMQRSPSSCAERRPLSASAAAMGGNALRFDWWLGDRMRTGYLEDKLRLKDVWSRPSDRVAPTRHGGVVLHSGARFQVVAEVSAKAELFKSLQLCAKTFQHRQWLVLGARFLNTVPFWWRQIKHTQIKCRENISLSIIHSFIQLFQQRLWDMQEKCPKTLWYDWIRA